MDNHTFIHLMHQVDSTLHLCRLTLQGIPADDLTAMRAQVERAIPLCPGDSEKRRQNMRQVNYHLGIIRLACFVRSEMMQLQALRVAIGEEEQREVEALAGLRRNEVQP